MYSLTIQHESKKIQLKWKLEQLEDDDDVIFTNLFFKELPDYNVRLLEENTNIGIFYKNIQIVQLYFHPERLMYFLQFIQSGSVVREFYLEEDVMEAKKKYTVLFDVMYAT
jgi:hypothetical protein